MGAAVIKPRHLTEKCADEIVQTAQRRRVERGLEQLFFTGLRVLNFCIDVVRAEVWDGFENRIIFLCGATFV